MKQILVELKDRPELFVQIEGILSAWKSGNYKQMLLHIYSGLEGEKFTEYVAKTLSIIFPEADIVGTMSAGEIMEGHLMNRGILIGALFFESTNVEVFRYDYANSMQIPLGTRGQADLSAA